MLDRRFEISPREHQGTVSGETDVGSKFDDLEEGINKSMIGIVMQVVFPIKCIKRRMYRG